MRMNLNVTRNDVLSLQRLWLLIRADFVTGYRSLLLVSGALAGAILLGATAARGWYFALGDGFYRECFALVLLVWGIVVSSRAFRPMHDKTRNEAWLLVPASALEKTLARLLAVTAGLVGYLLLFIVLVSVFIETLNLLLFGDRGAFFNPFEPAVRDRIWLYLFLQPFFFLGGAWFRRAHLVKTTLAATVAAIAAAAFALATVRIVFAGFMSQVDAVSFVLWWLADANGGGVDASLVAIALLVPLAGWGTAWLRVREAEVSDGV